MNTGGRFFLFLLPCTLWLIPRPCPKRSIRSSPDNGSFLVCPLLIGLCLQVGSIVPDNAPIVMGMPDTFFDDDTLIQRIVIQTSASFFIVLRILTQVDKLTDGAEMVAGCFRIRPEQRGQLRALRSFSSRLFDCHNCNKHSSVLSQESWANAVSELTMNY